MRSNYRPTRVWMLGAMLLAVGYLASSGLAQDVTTSDPALKPAGENVVSIVLHNVDFVFVVIAALSIIALSLMIISFIRLRQGVFYPPAVVATIRGMIEQRQFKELYDYTSTDDSFVGNALNAAIRRSPKFNAMKEAMETSVGEQTAEQFRKIEYLNIIGNLGPLLGLLGTVLGMIKAFSDMQAAGGNADPSVLAGGISKALAHTFLGLFLAVPSLAAFGVLRTMVDRLTIRAALIAEDLLILMRPEDDGRTAVTPGTGQRTPAAPLPGRPRVNPIPAPPAAPAGL